MQRMRDARNLGQTYAMLTGMLRVGARKRMHILGAAILFAICALLAIFNGIGAAAISNQSRSGISFDSLSSTPFLLPLDYSKFSHSSPGEHAALMGDKNCASCHRSTAALEPSFPKHSDCTKCHMAEFTVANGSSNSNPICTVCHNDTDLNSSKTQTKRFSRLRSFDSAFDHAQH